MLLDIVNEGLISPELKKKIRLIFEPEHVQEVVKGFRKQRDIPNEEYFYLLTKVYEDYGWDMLHAVLYYEPHLEQLGRGSSAIAWDLGDNRVVKYVMFEDLCYTRFIEMVADNQDVPYFPKVYGIEKRGSGAMLVFTEKVDVDTSGRTHYRFDTKRGTIELDPFVIASWPYVDQFRKYAARFLSKKEMEQLSDRVEKNWPGITRAVGMINDIVKETGHACDFDLPFENMGWRGDTPVVIDPLCGDK